MLSKEQYNKAGGRPSLPEEDKRTLQVKLVFNKKEFRQLKKFGLHHHIDFDNGRNMAPFFRTFLLSQIQGGQVVRDRNFTKLIYEVNKIGHNINQIARLANTKIKHNSRNNIMMEVNKAYRELLTLTSAIQVYMDKDDR